MRFPSRRAVIRIYLVTKRQVTGVLSAEQRSRLEEVEARAVKGFRGSYDDLESALGMLRLGHHFGWRVLYLVHSKLTIRKYEGILGVRVREEFSEEGPSSSRSVGFELAQKVGNFWKVVSGAVRLEGRREIKK